MTQTEEATGRIRIINTPAGSAPLEIREAWVMEEALPCYPYLGYPAGPVRDVVTRGQFELRKSGVVVPQAEALKILERHNPVAAKWWRDRGFPQWRGGLGQFFFTEDEYIIISGVTRRPLRVFDNMETGHWRQMLP